MLCYFYDVHLRDHLIQHLRVLKGRRAQHYTRLGFCFFRLFSSAKQISIPCKVLPHSGSLCGPAVGADAGGSAEPQGGQHMATNALISESDA